MREKRVWARLLGLERVVIESVEIDDRGQVVVAVRPHHRERDRCGVCGRPAPGFDLGEGRRRWRALDLGTSMACLEAQAPRVRCREHGVVVSAVAWARQGSGFTHAFEQQTAWLAVHASQRRQARSCGSPGVRSARSSTGSWLRPRRADLLASLRRIGIDEITHRKGQRYLTVVVYHDSGRLVWAAPGRDKATVEAFFDALGSKRAKRLKLVSCDMAGWIEAVLAKRCPQAKRCVDPFHVVALATEALDRVRREVWNEARRQGQTDAARELKGARFCLWKNPENLTARQQSKLADIERVNRPLYRAYLLKEQLRQIYRLGPRAAIRLLDEWLSWARRSRLRPFVKLARTIAEQREGIVAAIRHGLSNARVEAINTQIRLIARRAFGFHSPEALISLAMLKLGGLCPPLPGRVTVT